MIATPVGVLAVHHVGLVWMQLQTDLRQPCRVGVLHLAAWRGAVWIGERSLFVAGYVGLIRKAT